MDLPKKQTQVVVIGGGPGGYGAAFRAADLGLKTTLVDTDPNPGGTCLYRGCIPSKALLHVADVLTEARDADSWGISFGKPKIDVDKLRSATDKVVKQLTGGLGQLAKTRKIDYLQGRGGFIGSNAIRVHFGNGDSQEVEFEHAIVATGSRPTMPPAFEVESDRVMTSTDALKLPDVPKSLLVVGGGYIGLELGSVYAALGSKVTVVEMTGSLMPGVDRDLVRPLAKRLEKEFEAIYLNTKVVNLKPQKNCVKVKLEGEVKEKEQTFDRVLVSIGRRPNSSGVNLSNTKAKIDDAGFIEVDDQLRTADPKIFAIGDVIGQPMLAHKATHEGRVAAEVIAGEDVAMDARAIPAVVFTDPEIAYCGLTETEAANLKIDVKVARFPWAASGRAQTLHSPEGLTKIITDPETGIVLGVGIVGAGAGELIAEGALAVEMGATAEDVALTIHPHPTLTESVMESAELIFGASTHYYKK